MAWHNNDKKEFRAALQQTCRTYKRLEMFVADELGEQLRRIAPSDQDLDAVAFDLIDWAESQGRLGDLYRAFQKEYPHSPFRLKSSSVQKSLDSPRAASPLKPSILKRREVLKYGGAGLVGALAMRGVRQYMNSNSVDSKPTVATPPMPQQSPMPAASTTPVFIEGSFTFATAVFSPNGKITKLRGEGRLRIFDLPGQNLEMVWVPPGSFWMGSPSNEEGRFDSEGPQHRVIFPQGFWMGRYPITCAQWRSVAGFAQVQHDLEASPSSYSGEDDSFPVDSISWDSAQEFCLRLSRELSHPFELPSEAQWEYSCRAGTRTPFSFGRTLTRTLANYGGPHRRWKTNVKSFPANGWGLHDMHGNTWEWCKDTWHPSYSGAPVDGTAWVSVNKPASHVLRGGSMRSFLRHCRSAHRAHSYGSTGIRNGFGFRVVCTDS